MRTLILSCNTGEGHNSCAKAIKEYYDQIGEVCVIDDALRFISPAASKMVAGGHVFIYRHLPGVFKWGYTLSEKHPALYSNGSAVYRFMAQGSERLHRRIVAGNFDAVVCTHMFASLMLTEMLARHPMALATSFVATDYTCSPSVKDSIVDRYFIPDAVLAPDFECAVITEDKMVPTGIPVRQMFYTSLPRDEAKRRAGVPPEHKHLLLMCGSMGCGPMEELVKLLSHGLSSDQHITVVCGRNARLEQKLHKQYGLRHNIHIRGYVQDMSALMDSADLYLTKPGGISVTEAAVKALPMVLIDAVAGCESYNSIHFIRKGGAKTGNTVEELAEICLSLLENDGKRQGMSVRLREMQLENAAKMIYETMREIKELQGTKDEETAQTCC